MLLRGATLIDGTGSPSRRNEPQAQHDDTQVP
jgi:hypothetical protein